jgi:hypothetical protein
MLHTTLEYAGVWDLVKTRQGRLPPLVSYKTTTTEKVYLRWSSSVIVFVAYQNCAPWFEARVGHLTGTTAMRIIKTIKFVLYTFPGFGSSTFGYSGSANVGKDGGRKSPTSFIDFVKERL